MAKLEILHKAIRQYRYNDSDDFVIGYDKKEVDIIVSSLTDKSEFHIREICIKILNFRSGVLFAAATVVSDHDEPVIAADILRAAEMENIDCSQCDDMEKKSLRKINHERGIQLRGL